MSIPVVIELRNVWELAYRTFSYQHLKKVQVGPFVDTLAHAYWDRLPIKLQIDLVSIDENLTMKDAPDYFRRSIIHDPVGTFELLALHAAYPWLSEQFPIVALGTPVYSSPYIYVPCLKSGTDTELVWSSVVELGPSSHHAGIKFACFSLFSPRPATRSSE